MAAPDRTLAGLRKRALDRADKSQENFPHIQRLNDALNSSYSRLWSILANAGGGELLAEQIGSDITTVALTELYALTPLPLKILRVMERNSPDDWRRMRLLDYDDLPHLSSVQGQQTVRVIGVSQVTTLDEDTDAIDARIPTGWEQYIVLDGAQYLLDKEESDTRSVKEERELLKAEIIDTMEPRDLGEADSIRDINRWRPQFTRVGENSTISVLRYRLEGSNLRLAETKWRVPV
jgi:hypothetical protein